VATPRPDPKVAKTSSAKFRRRSAPTAVYFEDRGTVLDAPLDVVWNFRKEDEEFHPKAHAATLRNFKSTVRSPVTTLVSYEMQDAGRWRRMVSRLTEIRPAVRIDEELEGPHAGSKKVFLYSPQGRKTSIDVLCYMQSAKLSPAQLKRVTMEGLAENHEEDVPFLRRFARKQRAPTR
jgi:hypothetical protein